MYVPLALVYPDGREVTAEGYCDGLVQDEPKGDNGFGYDPYFYVPEFEKTMAELSIEEKGNHQPSWPCFTQIN